MPAKKKAAKKKNTRKRESNLANFFARPLDEKLFREVFYLCEKVLPRPPGSC